VRESDVRACMCEGACARTRVYTCVGLCIKGLHKHLYHRRQLRDCGSIARQPTGSRARRTCTGARPLTLQVSLEFYFTIRK